MSCVGRNVKWEHKLNPNLKIGHDMNKWRGTYAETGEASNSGKHGDVRPNW
jgi:hypothetical protein